LIESQVQGKNADKEITRAIRLANKADLFDLIILARGGGSIEDLWCFNMETVAREIANSHLPIISAIGHETDFTISDFVADLRAPTPSAAAEIISQNHSNLIELFSRNRANLENALTNKINQLIEELEHKATLLRHPGEKLRETSQKIDNFEIRMKDLEKEAIIRTLRFYNNNRRKTAKSLGVSERTLYRKIEDYKLEPKIKKN